MATKVIKLKPVKPNVRIEVEYLRQLLKIVKATEHYVNTELINFLKDNRYQYETRLSDSLYDANIIGSIVQIISGFSIYNDEYYQKLATDFVGSTKDVTLKKNTELLQKYFGVNVQKILENQKVASVADNYIQQNVQLIKSIPADYLDSVQKSVVNSVTRGGRFETITDDIKNIGSVTESRAKLIARDQTAKITKSIQQAQAQAYGAQKAEYVSSNDERTRQTHRDADGKVFTYGDSISDLLYEINCRCTSAPIIEIQYDN